MLNISKKILVLFVVYTQINYIKREVGWSFQLYGGKEFKRLGIQDFFLE